MSSLFAHLLNTSWQSVCIEKFNQYSFFLRSLQPNLNENESIASKHPFFVIYSCSALHSHCEPDY